MAQAVAWWLTIELLGLAALPLAVAALQALPDRGYSVSKTLGLLVTSWLAYLVAMGQISPFGRGLLVVSVIVLLAFSAWLLFGPPRIVLTFRSMAASRTYVSYVLVFEILFAVAFAAWALFRAYAPEILTTERFMDFGFLNSIVRTGHFPPGDMWLSGYSINYYYYGFVMTGALTLLSGVPTGYSFNLANASLFALTLCGGFGLGFNLAAAAIGSLEGEHSGPLEPSRNWLPGLSRRAPYLLGMLTACMLALMGNLTTIFAVRDSDRTLSGGWRFCLACQKVNAFDWFNATRVIQDYRTTYVAGQAASKTQIGLTNISEFPAFSFLLGDVHAHVLALPLALAALSLALNFALSKPGLKRRWPAGRWLTIPVAALVAGSLYATNSWDYPTYLLVILAGILLSACRSAGTSVAQRFRPAAGIAVKAGLLVVMSLLAFVPFLLTFRAPTGGEPGQLPPQFAALPLVGGLLDWISRSLYVNTADRTITGFLLVFGIALAGIIGWLALELGSANRRSPVEQRVSAIREQLGLWALLAISILSVAMAIVLRFPLLALLLPIASACGYFLTGSRGTRARDFVLVLVGTGAIIGLVIEVVDFQDGSSTRLNTVFKFYYQLWVLWTVAGAFGLWRLAASARAMVRSRAGERSQGSIALAQRGLAVAAYAWVAICCLLIVSGLAYPVFSVLTISRQHGSTLQGLDGTAFLARAAPDDYAAIQWLRANARPGSVLLECCSGEYNTSGYAGRVSSFTGIPTIIAWDGHEINWRVGDPAQLNAIAQRRADVTAIYTASGIGNGTQLLAALGKYGVNYVFVGDVERGAGPSGKDAPSAEMIKPLAASLFQQTLQVAFRSGSTVVYRVP